MRIAFFGGSFDPPHLGHKAIIEYASKIFDKLIIIPNKISLNQSKIIQASSDDRIQMLSLMIDDKKVIIDDYEIQSDKNYTFYTYKYLENKYHNDDITMIIGEDQLLQLDNWYNADWISENVKIMCFKREQDMMKNSSMKIRSINFIELSENISSRVIRSCIKENKSFRGYVDNRVHAYIRKVKLYK